MSGVLLVDGGSLLDISCWNIVRDSMMVIWRDIFFLDFIGRWYFSIVIIVIRVEGMNRLFW